MLRSSCLGNLFEHYDTALFGFLSPFLAPLIFPGHDHLTALILTFAMIPLGMLARPLGSLVFGYIGDLHGRRKALYLTLGGMSLVSCCIAFIPTYEEAGIIAPLLFCLGRALQNFFGAGETMGGAVFLLENSAEKKHDLLSSLYHASTVGGILLASFGVSLLYYFDGLTNGWRLLYLAGGIMTCVACLIRSRLPEGVTPKRIPYKMGTIIWQYRRPFTLIVMSAGLSYASYSMALILMNGFIPLVSPLRTDQMMGLNTLLLALDFFALPLFGWLSSKIGRERLMISAALLIAISAMPLFMVLKGASLTAVILIRICLVLLGVAFSAPFHAWAQQLIPGPYRYLIISFGYAVGSQLLGGPSLSLSLWLYKHTGIVTSVSWYWIALAVTTGFLMKQSEPLLAKSPFYRKDVIS